MGKKQLLAGSAALAAFAIALCLSPGSAEEPHGFVEVTSASASSTKRGVEWLLAIQNRNGSWG